MARIVWGSKGRPSQLSSRTPTSSSASSSRSTFKVQPLTRGHGGREDPFLSFSAFLFLGPSLLDPLQVSLGSFDAPTQAISEIEQNGDRLLPSFLFGPTTFLEPCRESLVKLFEGAPLQLDFPGQCRHRRVERVEIGRRPSGRPRPIPAPRRSRRRFQQAASSAASVSSSQVSKRRRMTWRRAASSSAVIASVPLAARAPGLRSYASRVVRQARTRANGSGSTAKIHWARRRGSRKRS